MYRHFLYLPGCWFLFYLICVFDFFFPLGLPTFRMFKNINVYKCLSCKVGDCKNLIVFVGQIKHAESESESESLDYMGPLNLLERLSVQFSLTDLWSCLQYKTLVYLDWSCIECAELKHELKAEKK